MVNKNTWNDEWNDFKGLNFFGRKFAKGQKNVVRKFLERENLPKTAKVLDFGCGSGRTLRMFRNLGFNNSIGVDVSPNSMKLCEKNDFIVGKDVFLTKEEGTSFNDNSFDLVFADGVLEHFEDFSPIVKEICRLSKKYILITQPNHFSLYGRILRKTEHKPVFEYTYRISDFEEAFAENGFRLAQISHFNFREHWALLFKKDIMK
ncbi:MAG: class I SAM-dependent methyltransferase [Candidatus Aenigmatarchaeota archaeon]